MMEAVAKWYVAEGAADLAGIKAAVYDPTDILGLATATPAPADVQRTTVVWKWVGDEIVMTVPGNDEEPTVTVSPAPGDGFNLVLDDGTGSGGTLVMKNVGGVWKIDVAATKRIAEAAGAQEDSSQPTETP